MHPSVSLRTSDDRVRDLVTRLCGGALAAGSQATLHIEDLGSSAPGPSRLSVRLAAAGGDEIASFSLEELQADPSRLDRILSRWLDPPDERGISRRIEEIVAMGAPDLMWSRFVDELRELAGAEQISLMFQDPFHERFTIVAGDDLPSSEEWVPGIPTEMVRSLDEGDDELRGFESSRDGTVVAARLVHGGEVFGFLRMRWEGGRAPGREEMSIAEEFVRRTRPLLEMSRALARERELAIRDDLTRAYNRRFFDRSLDEEIERARRYHHNLSLIFLDLDDLKLVNSRSGHLTGSRVLQETARRILEAVRSIDRVVRFGGDEFCILLPQTDLDRARTVAERVRDAISAEPIIFDGMDPILLTASFGVASYPDHAATHDEIIRAADAAMYRVKCRGKNAIGFAGDDGGQSQAM